MGVLSKRVSSVREGKIVDDDLGDYTEEESSSDSESNDVEVEMKLAESDDDEDEMRLAEPSNTAVFNRDGLLEKLHDISWPDNVEWIHKLTVDVNQEQEVDVNDDLTRELAFYTQALDGTRKAFEKLQSLGIPFLRTSDYYAEMVKTDSHMVKIKGCLLAEKKRMEEAEERRKAREAKKISKEVQAQKTKERAQQNKQEIESVKKWRKQRQQSGFASGDNGENIGLPFEDGKSFERTQKKRPWVAPGDRSGGKGRQGGGMGKKGIDKRKTREHRDSNFGFGGRKGMKKQNTADTTNDFKGFNKGDFSGDKKRKR